MLMELEVALVDLEVFSDPVEVESLEDGRGQHQGAAQRVDRAQSSQTGIQEGSQVPSDEPVVVAVVKRSPQVLFLHRKVF